MATEYHYYITTEQRVIPPIPGVYNFVATVSYLGKSENSVKQPLTAPLSEEWGETQEEARQNLEARIEQWIVARAGIGGSE
jgi:hypothetical protein